MNYFKEGLPYDEKMQSEYPQIHQPQSPSALSQWLHIDVNYIYMLVNEITEEITVCVN